MLIKKLFKVSATRSLWGYIWLPEDYETTSYNCPLLIYNHDFGNKGGTEAGAEALLNVGPLWHCKNGEKMEFVDPVTGKTEKFIILALQDSSWSPTADDIKYCLENEILGKYRIDQSCISVSGCSAGGERTLQCAVHTGLIPYLCAALPFAPAGGAISATLIPPAAQSGLRVFGHCGLQDDAFYKNLVAFDKGMNTTKPGSSRMMIYEGGHGGWTPYFSPAFRTNLWSDKPMNMFEFILACRKGGTWLPVAPRSTDPMVLLTPGNSEITDMTGITVDASGSLNAKLDSYTNHPWDTFLWDFVRIKGNNWDLKFADTGGAYGGPKRTIVGYRDGDVFKVKVTMKNVYGKLSVSESEFTIKATTLPPAPPPPPPPPPAKVMVAAVVDFKEKSVKVSFANFEGTISHVIVAGDGTVTNS